MDEDIEAVIISVSALVTFILSFGMKDTINNLASGVWIASSRAYNIGDDITAAGHHGFVTDMNMMATELKQMDNSRIIVPNGNAWNNPIVYSSPRCLGKDPRHSYGTRYLRLVSGDCRLFHHPAAPCMNRYQDLLLLQV